MTTDKTNKETDEETEVFYTSSCDRATRTTLYAQDNRRVHRPVRRGRTERTDRWRQDGPSWRQDGHSGRPDGPRKNLLGPDGNYERCHFCNSIWHYVNGCPDVKRLKREYRNKKDDRDNKDSDRDVHLSI